MEHIIALLAGGVHKLYDDVHDNNITLSPVYDELIKVIMVCLMTILFIQNPTTSAFFLIVILIYWSVGKIDCDFWKACIPIPIITTLVNYDKFIFTSWPDVFQRGFFIALIGGIMRAEDSLFPEETSVYKTCSRVFLIALMSGIIWYTCDFSAKGFIHSILLFLIGYLAANIGFHAILPTVKNLITTEKSATPQSVNQTSKQETTSDAKTDRETNPE
jgi:hypothetical protein